MYTVGIGGTTAVACVRLNRCFVGIELDETHHRTASTRLASKFNQPGIGQSRFRQPIIVQPVVSKFHKPETAVDVHDAVPFVAPVPQLYKPPAVHARALTPRGAP